MDVLGDGFKHNYGFGNPNWISIQLAGIVIIYLFLRNREKILGMILDLGIIGAVIYFIRYSTGGRTSVIGLAVVLVATIVCDLCHLIPCSIRQKYAKVAAIFNFVVTECILFGTAVMAMYLSWTYDEDNESRLFLYIRKVFNTSTLEKRLDSAHRGLLNYTPKLFGQIVIEVNGLKAVETGEQFFWLDVFYVRLLFGVSLAPPLALLALSPALLYVLSFLRTIVNGFGISKANAFWLVTGILVMENLREKSIARIGEAEAVIKAISDASSGETYVDNVPDVYDKEYTRINKPFFYGDELSFF